MLQGREINLLFLSPAPATGDRTWVRWRAAPMLYTPGIHIIHVGWRGRCVMCWSRTPMDPGLIPGAGDKKQEINFSALQH